MTMARVCGGCFVGLALVALVAVAQDVPLHEDQPSITHNVDKPESGSVEVKEFLIDSTVEDIQWCSRRQSVVFVRSALGTLYRSDDHGKTWKYQMDKLLGLGVGERAGVAEIVVSEANRDHVFLQGFGSTHWVTRDAGSTYEAITAFPIKQVVLHKRWPEWLLVSSWSEGCKNTEEKQNCNVEVRLSQDFGTTWLYLDSYVAQFGWGRPHLPEEIFMVRFDHTTGNQKFGAWDKDAHLYRSTDLWKTNTKLIPHGNRFLMMEHYMFVAMVNAEKTNQVQLVVAKGDQLTYEIGRLPFELNEHSYTILDASNGAVFLHVNHGDYSTPYGTIYVSDADGWKYTLSLRNNRRDVRGRCDFERVQGLQGIFIANYVDNPEYTGTWGEREHIATVMSFDNGGRWNKLKAPEVDADGKPTECGTDSGCSLHLHGITDEWGPFYTTKNALGLILATGNMGRYLDMTHAGTINTYLSRDAGLTWTEVRKGSHIYEFGDHGAILAMAKDREATKEVLYSWNEGLSWKSVPLPALTQVENIITEPNSTSTSFVLYGSRNGVGVLVHLDFDGLHTRECQGVEAVGSPQSSYELWSPSDGVSQCLLGAQIHYTRRKRAEECYNPRSFMRHQLVKYCPCTEADYECDYGYERQALDGPCVSIKAIPTPDMAQCPVGGEFTVSNGYRLVAGNKCDAKAGVDHLPTVVRCGRFGSATKHGWSVLLTVFLVAMALFVATLVGKDPERMEQLRSWMTETRVKYHKLDMKPGHFSDDDDDFALGEEMEEDPNQDLLHDSNLNAFGDEEDMGNAFGPLPIPEGEGDSEVPALQPPPGSQPHNEAGINQEDDDGGDVFSALAGAEGEEVIQLDSS